MTVLSAAAMTLPQRALARAQPCVAGPRSHAAPWPVHAAMPAKAAPKWQSRRPLVVCQAVEERVDLAKIADEPGVGLGTVFSPYTLAPLALGGGASFALGNTSIEGIALGTAVGALARAAQVFLLESTVPFTRRRHTLLLPVSWELAFGAKVFQQQLLELESKGKVLPASSSDYKVVQKIAERVIKAVEEGRGGGFQDHVSKFHWEVVVVEDKTPNAFVLPGGKIVVFTGLIKLLDRDEDLLAAVLGHEVAHALARHSSEKLTLGLTVTVFVNLALAAFNFYQRRQIEQQQRQGGGRPGAYGGPGGGFPGGRGGGFPGIPAGMGGRPSPYGMGYRSPYSMGRAPRGGGFGSPGVLNPQIISIFTNLFLQMPFSRRAEAEADLIGLKLMALAGYNAEKAPETFRRLGAMEVGGKMANMAGSNTARMVLQVQCTHPRSDSRVKMLTEELDMMKQHGDTALDRVMHPVSYWSL